MYVFDRWTGISNRYLHFWRFHDDRVPTPQSKFPEVFQKAGGGVRPHAEGYWHAPYVAPPTTRAWALSRGRARGGARIESWPAAPEHTPGATRGGKHTYILVNIHVNWFLLILFSHVQFLFGPEWRRHTLLVLTHADHLKGAALQPSVYITQTTDSLRALAEGVVGGVSFLDNSCDWPSIRGRPLRDRLLRLSARNHHTALSVRTDVSLGLWTLVQVYLQISTQHASNNLRNLIWKQIIYLSESILM